MPSPSAWAYQALDLPPSATPTDIRLAYKRLSLATHPDKTRDPDSRPRFDLIVEAYNFLSDSSVRDENQHQTVSPVITDEIEVSEMEENDDGLLYSCRCGGSFVVEKERVNTVLESGRDGVVVSCDGCSLAIKVSPEG